MDRFRTGLTSMMYIYGHHLINGMIQSKVPGDFHGATYDESGWCSFESAASSLLNDDNDYSCGDSQIWET